MQNTMPLVPEESQQAASDACLPVGTRLADFEITGVIGEGGFGIVYRAFDHSLQRTVAIKEYMPSALARRGEDNSVVVRLPRERETFDAGLKSFINEARLLARFDHPALVKVYRFWEQNHTAYMAMRHYDGQTVKGVIKNRPELIDERWLKGMLGPVLEALETLYRVQILHRDISPDNIMIQDGGSAVLLDFGAARQIIGGMNHVVTVILKPGYAPVEQYANDAGMEQGPWTDIYSLCAVVYYAIVKKPPPTSVVRMIKDPMERLQDGNYPGYGKAFLAAIDAGLAVRPEDRPRSIDAFRKLLDLRQATSSPGMADTAVRVVPDPLPASSRVAVARRKRLPEIKRRTRAVLAASIAAIACGVGLATFAVVKPRQATPPTAQAAAEVAPTKAAVAAPAVEMDALARLAEEKSAHAAAPGAVRFNIKPWGTVYVDGVNRGVSPPLKKLELAEGTHQIRIENPNFPAQTTEISVTSNKTANLEHEFSAKHK